MTVDGTVIASRFESANELSLSVVSFLALEKSTMFNSFLWFASTTPLNVDPSPVTYKILYVCCVSERSFGALCLVLISQIRSLFASGPQLNVIEIGRSKNASSSYVDGTMTNVTVLGKTFSSDCSGAMSALPLYVTDVSLEHSRNAPDPMDVTFDGIVTLVIAESPLKASLAIVLTVPGIFGVELL